ncbi:MAG: choice-of-anchor tandem repeat GloVer-containing protein [Rhizomicrobium sp.]
MSKFLAALAFAALTSSVAGAQPVTNNAGYDWTPFAQQNAGSKFTDIYDFSSTPCYYPIATPVFVGKVLYGFMNLDQSEDIGCIFSLTPKGSKATYKTVYPFKLDGDPNNVQGTPIVIGNYIYNTSFDGGANENGSVFRYGVKTGKIEVLHSFQDAPDGGSPTAGLALAGSGNLFGVALEGSFACGDAGCGMVYEMVLNKKSGNYTYKILHKFDTGNGGNYPRGAPTVFNGAVYGTTSAGGKSGEGTVYELVPGKNGKWTYSLIHAFTGKNDGGASLAALTLYKGSLYGTTRDDGQYGGGVLFKLTPPAKKGASWTFTALHQFKGGSAGDGYGPITAPVVGNNGILYGLTVYGGHAYSDGAIYAFNVASGKEAVVYKFPQKNGQDWGTPQGNLALSPSGVLYGLIEAGGAHEYGYAFSFKP